MEKIFSTDLFLKSGGDELFIMGLFPHAVWDQYKKLKAANVPFQIESGILVNYTYLGVNIDKVSYSSMGFMRTTIGRCLKIKRPEANNRTKLYFFETYVDVFFNSYLRIYFNKDFFLQEILGSRFNSERAKLLLGEPMEINECILATQKRYDDSRTRSTTLGL